VVTTYFVTGATGFLGRRLVALLLGLERTETVYVLVRPGSVDRLTELAASWPRSDKIDIVRGDLTLPDLGIDPEDLPPSVDHVVHLGAIYDFTASTELNETTNVTGTERVIDLAERLGVGYLHHVSSVAVAGDHRGPFTEDDFDLGQHLPSPYHATKFAAEKLVRTHARMPWRIYRPSAVVGDSTTGEMDKIDGPYYFLPAIARLAALPRRLPLIAPDLGATNVVPVDYVVAAIAHLMHVDVPSGQTFHLVSPRPQPLTEVYNEFARAAGAPRIRRAAPAWTTTALRRRLTGGAIDRVAAKPSVRNAVITELGIPPTVLPHLAFGATFESAATRKALAGSGIEPPELRTYAGVLWRYWADHLDPDRARRSDRRHPLAGRTVMITGASSGIGRATALEVARRSATVLLVARRADELAAVRDEIESAGGIAYVHPCDLTDGDAVEALVKQVIAEHDAVDMLVNNAGRSIRRSVSLSVDRLHDFERTMTLNYFAPLRLILGLLPYMRARGFGHIVNVTTMGLDVGTPRFAAYLASKAALEEFGRVAGRELLGDGITVTSVRMPLVRTPMITATRVYRTMPAATPEKAASMVVEALERRPVVVRLPAGRVAELANAVAPKTMRLLAYVGYAVMPESAPEVQRGQRRPPLASAIGAVTRLAWRAIPRRDARSG
jgi:thioester reductase-like protein/NADP-dependent 3-hydroxy acid dehydrogenase YdfG